MRCISPSPRYSIQVIEANEQVVVDARGFATSHVLKKPVIANFQQAGLLDHEIEAALEHFNFSGVPEGINPLTRIGVFDTEAYVQQYQKHERDEMLVQIDQRLRELQERFPSEYIIVDPPESPKPWPSYDDDSIEDVIKFQERLQINPEMIRLYELENANRTEIVEAMLRQEDPEGAEALYGPAPSSEEKIEVDA